MALKEILVTKFAVISLQVGCAMNCQFCLTGRMGLLANLSTAQIVEQVLPITL